jgi:hypothetical protein
MLLTERRIQNAKYYAQADPEAYSFLLSFLKTKRYWHAKAPRGLNLAMPSHPKALWRPEQTELFDVALKSRVQGRLVVHQGMHALITHRYGASLNGRSGLTLLAEGIAGAVERYFDFCHVGAGRKQRIRAIQSMYGDFANVLGLNLEACLHRLAENPFQSFRENALLSYEISLEMFELARKLAGNRPIDPKALIKKLEHNDQYIFLYNLDFPNFILFTATYCGFKRSAQDLRDTRDCLRILNTSASMSEFLNKMRVKSHVGKSANLA